MSLKTEGDYDWSPQTLDMQSSGERNQRPCMNNNNNGMVESFRNLEAASTLKNHFYFLICSQYYFTYPPSTTHVSLLFLFI